MGKESYTFLSSTREQRPGPLKQSKNTLPNMNVFDEDLDVANNLRAKLLKKSILRCWLVPCGKEISSFFCYPKQINYSQNERESKAHISFVVQFDRHRYYLLQCQVLHTKSLSS